MAALEILIDEGVDRVLSSGQCASALEGSHCLANLVRVAGDRIVILAGAGISEDTVGELVHLTGVQEVHASARLPVESKTLFRPDPPVHMGGEKVNSATSEFERKEASADRVALILNSASIDFNQYQDASVPCLLPLPPAV